ncbi:enoyl-CoA hydratase/isomerase family protein [Flavilitoribacter nigricans]|uniref:Enoyl-CoA hydratase n=1 Tax=Flavilitoribacter nigricans (strain ATCC 23147 / DSM 23189 / NBRC 102662 / NCIMB 1420 / SS-2) TaxID=1122177 RepID=A0A2D0N880_FLAN2|nr:enoyl-CoA hydratase [Flavilitoribacter nigricans]PHN04695.1 enoyl-CoA hydratase [Flavilitoribacter nigricans DSM 23189 = NBRC 102662]
MANPEHPINSNSAVLYHEEGPVAVITLNRPSRYNAFNDALIQGLNTSLDQAAADPNIRVIILRGAGPGFSAGADLGLFAGVTPEQGRDYIKSNYRPLMRKFCDLPKPIIGAIHGTAAGVGCALALACDLRVMTEDASFRYAFINIGLGPDGGAGWFLARAVGYSRAMEIACSGEKIGADRCLELGLTNRIAPVGEMMAFALEWANELAQKAPIALGITKADLQFAIDHTLDETVDFEADQQMAAFSSEDLREGVGAFLAKRPPRFKGK